MRKHKQLNATLHGPMGVYSRAVAKLYFPQTYGVLPECRFITFTITIPVFITIFHITCRTSISVREKVINLKAIFHFCALVLVFRRSHSLQVLLLRHYQVLALPQDLLNCE